MGMAGWLARLLNDEGAESNAKTGSTSAFQGAQGEAAAGLNFRTAIEAHQKWKMRLQAVIEARSQEKLDPNVVSRDDQCDLGKWIHGPAAGQFAGDPQFGNLKRKHAYFHVCASRVLSLAQSGQKEKAVAEMSAVGEFGRASREVVGDLASLFVRLTAAKQ
jgi:hypothetical protein